MKRIAALALVLLPMVSACQTSLPVSASCPPPDPLPVVLTESVSTPPTLVERFERSYRTLLDSLSKAIRQ